MEIKQYLKYYVGCECLNSWFPQGHEMRDNGWWLHGYKPSQQKCFYLENDEEETWTDSIIPILRRLSSITEEEAIQLARLVVHESEFTDIKTYRDKDGDLVVESKHDLYNATGEKVWSAEQLHYLLSHGFWLFGDEAFETGLIIEKK